MRAAAAILAVIGLPASALASGHGPVYGLATPTLGKGAFSLDVAAMGLVTDSNGRAAMRPMVGYGITEDLQVSASLPIPIYSPNTLPAQRMMIMMPATPDAELQLQWRFQRRGVGVGSRFESTAFVGVDYPLLRYRPDVPAYPAALAAVVTGYASRSFYVWAGGFYRRVLYPIGDTIGHGGDLVMYSLVVGYRPPWFRHELPKADWRIFVEGVGEYAFPDQLAGMDAPNSGGHRIYVGPTVLGLYGPWGISGGPMFRVYENVNGTPPNDLVRLVVNFTYWWF